MSSTLLIIAQAPQCKDYTELTYSCRWHGILFLHKSNMHSDLSIRCCCSDLLSLKTFGEWDLMLWLILVQAAIFGVWIFPIMQSPRLHSDEIWTDLVTCDLYLKDTGIVKEYHASKWKKTMHPSPINFKTWLNQNILHTHTRIYNI